MKLRMTAHHRDLIPADKHLTDAEHRLKGITVGEKQVVQNVASSTSMVK